MIELPEHVKSINRRLKKFGLNPNKLPIYRVVFSDDEYEMRRGEFNVFHNKIFLRTEIGVRKVKKYSYIKSKFVIEKWIEPAIVNMLSKDEIVDNNGYEPIYVFEDKDGNFLRPIWRVAENICYANQNPIDYWERKKQLDEEELKQEKEDYDVVATEHDRTSIGLALATGEGVGFTKEIKSNE
jgi:hypothetical protein